MKEASNIEWTAFDSGDSWPTRFFATLKVPGLPDLHLIAIAVESEPGADNGRRAVNAEDQDELDKWCAAASIVVGETCVVDALQCLVFAHTGVE